MKVFITGGTGFLGRAIVKKMLNERHTVTCLLLPDDDASLASGAEIERGDITDFNTLVDKTSDHDAIVHLAGAVGYGQTWNNCISLNRDGTTNIAREAFHSGIRRFIHMSSVSVYGRIADKPISEDFPVKKIGDPYGDTKIDAEDVLKSFAEMGKLDLTIIRPTMIYGPGDNLFMPKVIENIKNGTARIIGDGNNKVDCIHVSDTACFVAKVLASPKTVGRIYNLTHPDNPTWKEMLADIADALGVPAPKKHVSYKLAYSLAAVMEALSFFTKKPPRLTRYAVRNVGRSYLYSARQMKEDLGFTPSISLKQGIHDYIKNLMEDKTHAG